MSATGRSVEAEVLTLDADESPKARAAFEREVASLVAAMPAANEAFVRQCLDLMRKGRKKTVRAKHDFYETPAWCIDAIVPHLPLTGEPIILDAGSGTGAISARLAAINPKAEIIAIEKQPELVEKSRARGLNNVEFRRACFLNDELDTLRAPDLVIMNPPFGFAMNFVVRALQIVKRGGTVCALLRLPWLASKSRREFHKKHPSDIGVLTKRPSFIGGGKTDATDYAWFLWGPDRGGRWFSLTHDDKSRRRPRAPRKTSNPATSEARGRDVEQEGAAREG